MDNEINEMIERVLIQRNKTVDNMILGEIRKIATENGIDTIITLNDKAIIQALKNFAEVKHGEVVRNERNIAKMKEFHEKGIGLGISEKSIFWTCSECGNLIGIYDNYCSNCGAKMDGGKAE